MEILKQDTHRQQNLLSDLLWVAKYNTRNVLTFEWIYAFASIHIKIKDVVVNYLNYTRRSYVIC